MILTPASGAHYQFSEASYHDRSTSSYYHGVWSDATSAWNNTGAFTWTEDTDPNCLTYTSSVSKDSGAWADATGMTWNNVTTDSSGNQTGAKIYLNRYNLKKYDYSQQERTYVAEHELGHAMGLAHNEVNSDSVMNPANRDNSIQTCDVDGINSIYNTQDSLNVSPSVDIEYAKDYSGGNGVANIKRDAQIIVAGTVTISTPHSDDLESGNAYTTQMLKIDNSLKGGITGLIEFNQAGTTNVKVADSQLLKKGDRVVVMLDKDDNGEYYVIDDGQGIFLNNSQDGDSLGTSPLGSNDLFVRVSDHQSFAENMLK